MFRRFLCLMILSSGTLALTSCGELQTYAGAPKPPEQTATIFIGSSSTLMVTEFDDAFSHRQLGLRSSLEILPGRHAIVVRNSQGAAFQDTCGLTLEAQPDTTYVLIEQRALGSLEFAVFLRPMTRAAAASYVFDPTSAVFNPATDVPCFFPEWPRRSGP